MTPTLARTILRTVALTLLALPAAAAEESKPAEAKGEVVLFESAALGGDGGNQLRKRHIGAKGTRVSVWVDPCKVAKVEFKEKPRNTRFYDELSTIVHKLVDRAQCPAQPPQEWTFITKLQRASVTVTALDGFGEVLETKTILTGPKESFFLTLDLPVTNSDTLKYDDEKGQVLPADDKPQLYLGLNFQWGDVLEEPSRYTHLDRLQLKAMIRASRHPKDSYGLGVGYNLDGLPILGFTPKGLAVFVGYFETKVDAIVDGVVVPKGAKDRKWQAGVSYEIGTALGWVTLK